MIYLKTHRLAQEVLRYHFLPSSSAFTTLGVHLPITDSQTCELHRVP